MLSVLKSLGEPAEPVAAVRELPKQCRIAPELMADKKYDIPTLEELGVDQSQLGPCPYPGGETEGLARLNRCLARKVRLLVIFNNIVLWTHHNQ